MFKMFIESLGFFDILSFGALVFLFSTLVVLPVLELIFRDLLKGKFIEGDVIIFSYIMIVLFGVNWRTGISLLLSPGLVDACVILKTNKIPNIDLDKVYNWYESKRAKLHNYLTK